jgi:AI-2 transport protein TqsA
MDPSKTLAEGRTPPAEQPVLALDSTDFLRKLAIGTMGVVLFWLSVLILQKFEVILQPLFVAVFIGYLILPAHKGLVDRGVPSPLAYVVILLGTLAALFGLGTLLVRSLEQLADRLPDYERRLEDLLRNLARGLPFEVAGLEPGFLSQWSFDVDLAGAFGRLQGFLSAAAVTFVYLIFLVAEKVTFPQRLVLAFGQSKSTEVLGVVTSINLAIAQYIAVKTFVSFAAGVLSMAVLALFQVDFYILWGILIFLLNYIPYLGSIVAVAAPILLSFVQLGLWQAIVIAVLLIVIQQVIGIWVEPRMAGQRLGVSPLLILLSLSFWGLVWGIVGMILAVPLLMVLKIVLANIKETRPIATLMSNV